MSGQITGVITPTNPNGQNFIDQLFGSTSTILNTAQTVTNAIVDGVNNISGIVNNDSRRNQQTGYPQVYGMPQQQVMVPQQQTYGYAYGIQPGQIPGLPMGAQPQNVGYPGFTDPNYGINSNMAPTTQVPVGLNTTRYGGLDSNPWNV